MKKIEFENFILYSSLKIDEDNDYKILDIQTGKMLSTNKIQFTFEEESLVKIKPALSKKVEKKLIEEAKKEGKEFAQIPGITYVKKEFIKKYHPDNIDVSEFWRLATKHFPHFSVAGGNSGCKTKEECNYTTLKMAERIGPLRELFQTLNEDNSANMLEIGPGYGNICYWINEHFPLINYYAIDVNPLFEWPTLMQTDGKTIPDGVVDNLDIVYSYNVFQHLSKKQRTSYYKQIHDKLRVGGVFYFGMFLVTKENKDWPCWGVKDYSGRNYCHFFKQFTEVDTEEELIEELNSIGFSYQNITKHADKHNGHAFKCVKF